MNYLIDFVMITLMPIYIQWEVCIYWSGYIIKDSHEKRLEIRINRDLLYHYEGLILEWNAKSYADGWQQGGRRGM